MPHGAPYNNFVIGPFVTASTLYFWCVEIQMSFKAEKQGLAYRIIQGLVLISRNVSEMYVTLLHTFNELSTIFYHFVHR